MVGCGVRNGSSGLWSWLIWGHWSPTGLERLGGLGSLGRVSSAGYQHHLQPPPLLMIINPQFVQIDSPFDVVADGMNE